MDRRRFLQIAGVVGGSVGAGCSSVGDDNEIQDSDGDGVIDSEDYAPNDPEVQEKSDLQDTDAVTPTPTATSTATPTPTSTPSPTPTPTPTPSPTPTPEANLLVVDEEYWQDSSHITSYSLRSVTTLVTEDFPETEFDSARLLVQLSRFPRNGVVTETLSTQFRRSNGPHELTVDIKPNDTNNFEQYNYLAALVPGDTTIDNINYSGATTAFETDPFTITDGATIERTSYSNQLDTDSGATFSRDVVEGAYQLEVSGRTAGRGWTVPFFAYKSAHAAARQRERGRQRPEYVSYELTRGSASELAALLHDEADRRNYSDREAVEFVIDFVQALPYVPDDVSRGFDDYTKLILETMPEMGGDCEDTAIMLASILEADPFGYDMILIQPPGHMAAGIYQKDPNGWYWELDGRKYLYIETTGQGWGVGDCPKEYQGKKATLHQV